MVISWSESIDIDRPVGKVYPALRDQHTLMRWSAWPEATGYTCTVDGDGASAGSSVVFTSPEGEEMGRQTIITLTATSVHNRLRNRGPGGRVVEPEVDFHAKAIDEQRTRVRLDFRINPPVPRLLQPVARVYLARKIRPLHVQDLENLKKLLEETSV